MDIEDTKKDSLTLDERSQSASADKSSDRKPGLKASVKKDSRHSLPLILAIFTALLFVFVLRVSKKSKPLPKSYAVCSKERNIYTVDENNPRVECIVIHESRILGTGSLDDIRKRWGDVDKTGPVPNALSSMRNGLKFYFIEPGHVIVPDAHAHLLDYGFKRNLELDSCRSAAEVIERVKAYVISHPDILKDKNTWIFGMGWDQTKWPGAKYPTAADFDTEPLLRGRLICLRRVDVHAMWVSPRAIADAGELPQSIEGGDIIRDDTGKPTGIFVDNAMALIKVSPWTDRQMLEYYGVAVKEALAYGLTSIHDAATSPQVIKFLKRMADENKLPLRLYLMGNVESDEYWGDLIDRFVNYGPARRLTLRSIKLMTDGALGSWGAALLEPYSDKPGDRGLLRTPPEVMRKLVKRFWEDGFQVNIHCIGDWANNVVLDIFEEILSGENSTERRPRIEHAQIMTADDLRRTARLGVIPSVQPTHATSDMWYAETRLGAERVKYAYAYKTLLELSDQHVLPLGSDFPVEGVNPLLGFYAAISRLSENGESPHGKGGWFPEQRLTRAEALKGMTLDPAYASFNEKDLGSLSPGKLADFVVLDTDIMTVPLSQILNTKVVATVIDGRPMYGKL